MIKMSKNEQNPVIITINYNLEEKSFEMPFDFNIFIKNICFMLSIKIDLPY